MARRSPAMVRRRRPPQWHLALTVVLLLAAVSAVVYLDRLARAGDDHELSSSPPASSQVVHADSRSFAGAIYANLDSVLAELGVWPDLVEKDPGEAKAPDQIRVRVPSDLPLASVNLHLSRFVRRHGGHVVRGEEVRGANAVDLTCGIDSTVTTAFRLRHDRRVRRRAGLIALVIDASGDTAANPLLDRLLALPQPLTVVAPGPRAAGLASASGHELLSSPPTEGTAIGGGSADDVRRQLWALAERAADEGHAVAVARPLAGAADAFEAMLPRLETRGYRFVPLSVIP